MTDEIERGDAVPGPSLDGEYEMRFRDFDAYPPPRGWLWWLRSSPVGSMLRGWRYSRLSEDALRSVIHSPDALPGEVYAALREFKRRQW